MASGFDPYYKWLGIPPEEQPPDHYRLLGLRRFESDPEVIEAASDQRMAHLRTYQAGQYSALSQKLLNEVAGAKICLLSPEKRAPYDESLKLAAPAAAPKCRFRQPRSLFLCRRRRTSLWRRPRPGTASSIWSGWVFPMMGAGTRTLWRPAGVGRGVGHTHTARLPLLP